MSSATMIETGTWTDICALDDIIPNTAVGALLGQSQIAVVRFGRDQVYALSNFDPFSRAMVISRGIVGDAQGIPKIASPIYKQGFDLRTGQCLDDPGVKIPMYDTRIIAGRVHVRMP